MIAAEYSIRTKNDLLILLDKLGIKSAIRGTVMYFADGTGTYTVPQGVTRIKVRMTGGAGGI